MSKKNQPDSHTVSEEESALFRETVGKVTPIQCDQAIHPQKRKRIRSHHRHQAPYRQQSELAIKHGEVPRFPNKNQLRKFNHGRLPIDARLDLHGKTHLQAENTINQFIEQANYLGCHCLLIIHGKGFNSLDNVPVLKELTHYLLSQHPSVASYTLASERHGGKGATYVLLQEE